MDWLQVVVLSVIQGLTEFLPISSSAHLILVPVLTEWNDQGLVFDVAMHLGSLAAVVLYFRHDLKRMGASWALSLRGRSLRGGSVDPDARLAWWVLLATIPVCVVGLAFHDVIEVGMRSPILIGITLIGFGLLLGYADWHKRGGRSEYQLTLRDAMLIGLAQALALIPGTSRSGITITAALLLGMSREGAARFSFLLSIPVTALAAGLEIVGLVQMPRGIDWPAMGVGVILSGVSAYLCIHYFIAFIKRIGMQPFVIYRIVLGLWLLWIFG
ncbi:undecaprenyl-diphosphate phosphatase [Halomonas sp. MCCC 1A17488]|uniref:undecaprenyl-diphosphate phosphatase n=1 Tax=unclassified Halomonas TaxID=2609666 RepID=UPI0018D27002|nr:MULTISPECIES: undecaprenyl-diphosphate phosphatase [unclassified Halomonas]MCE8017296.1 undecaprenyl-diphosphate phosphatase [Halomonas sp. MCCC 1A17488]MCG3240629.1 undecaprenyl-diphosphate phosphatase [Halomonas sp. MCCC 1A17488]QPP49524.1 undecaprenyl-diphosphate phosphatase [Halomonas sp. SS10-MC5]